MTAVKTADRVVVSVTATDSGDWQVVSIPTGFQGIVSTLFSDNDFLHGFCRHEDGEQWEVYDFDDDDSSLLQVTNISGTVTLARPATPYDSSKSDGSRMDAGSGTHTLTLSLGSGTLKRLFRENSPFFKTFAAADSTPAVDDYRFFKTQGTTAITRFDELTNGQRFLVQRGNADIEIQHNGTNIVLFGGRHLKLTADAPVAEFVVDAGVAKQVSGSFAETAVAKRILIVEDYAELRAYDGPVTVAYTYGEGFPDATEKLFDIDVLDTTSVDDGVMIIKDALDRRWKRRVSSNRFNVRLWGGEPSTSTTVRAANNTAVANALTFLGNRDGGGSLYFPSGRDQDEQYHVSQTFNVPPNVEIEGDGYDTIVNWGALSGSGHTGDGFDFGISHHCSLKNIYLTQAGRDGYTFIKAGGSHPAQFYAENVASRFNGRHGVHIGGLYNANFMRCNHEYNGQDDDTGCGIAVTTLVTSIHFDQCQSGHNADAGYLVNEALYSQFTACGADENGGAAYDILNCMGVVFSGCGSERNVGMFRFRASTVLGTGHLINFCSAIKIQGCFGLENTGTSFLSASSSDGLLIMLTVEESAELSSGGTSISLSGNVRVTHNNLRMLGSTSTSGGAVITPLSGFTPANNTLPYFDGSSAPAMASLTAHGRSLIASADAAAARTTLAISTNDNAFTATQTFSATDPMIVKGNQAAAQFKDAGNTLKWILGLRNDIAGNANDLLLYNAGIAGGLKIAGADNTLTVYGPALFPNVSTTASGANAFLDNAASNSLLRSTSSEKYKRDIEDIELSLVDNFIERARPVWYRSKCAADNPEWGFFGLIAEELAEIAPQFVVWSYAEDQYEDIEIEERFPIQAVDLVEVPTKVVNIIDGRAVQHEILQSVEVPRFGDPLPLFDETGNPVMMEASVVGEDGVEAVVETQVLVPNPVMTERVLTRVERRLKENAVKTPDGIFYDRISVFLLAAIKQLRQAA